MPRSSSQCLTDDWTNFRFEHLVIVTTEAGGKSRPTGNARITALLLDKHDPSRHSYLEKSFANRPQ